MTQLQTKALEHVDWLLINAHNDANNLCEEKKGHTMEMRAEQLRSDIHDIQMWCRTINSDPMPKIKQ